MSDEKLNENQETSLESTATEQNFLQRIGTNIKNKWKNFVTNTKDAFVDFGHSAKEWWKRLRGRSFKENMKALWTFLRSQKGWVWLLPALVLLAIFTVYPIFNTIIIAFKNGYNGVNFRFDGIGVENFKTAVQSSKFNAALVNTILFAFISVPISTLLALIISIGLASIKWVQKAYQTIFFLPYLTNSLAIGSVFAVMFSVTKGANETSWGLINNIFGSQIDWIGVGGTNFTMRFVVILYEIWSGLPFKILILFGALQNVNKQYYDAAKIDGATKFRTITKVTVPLISPMISYLVITGFIGGFKSYSAIVGIFGPNMGPVDYEMVTIVGLIYYYMTPNNDAGYAAAHGVASAAALILFALIMVFTFINMQMSKRRVHY